MKGIVIRTPKTFFIALTSDDSPRHHGDFHRNTSQYVVTTFPRPGDLIKYTLPGVVIDDYDIVDGELVLQSRKAELSVFSVTENSQEKEVKLRVLSHPGRSPMLGEDTLDDAFGYECLASLWLEKLDERVWQYAPCEVEEIPEPGDEAGEEAWMRWRFDDKIRAEWDEENGWTLVNTDAELESRVNKILEEKARKAAVEKMRDRVSLLSAERLFALIVQMLPVVDDSSNEWIARMCREYTNGNGDLSIVQNAVTWTLFNSRQNFQLTINGNFLVYEDDSVNPDVRPIKFSIQL
jgi:hypothetical protein